MKCIILLILALSASFALGTSEDGVSREMDTDMFLEELSQKGAISDHHSGSGSAHHSGSGSAHHSGSGSAHHSGSGSAHHSGSGSAHHSGSGSAHHSAKTTVGNAAAVAAKPGGKGCKFKLCTPVCNEVTKTIAHGKYKIPFQKNVCVDDKACLKWNEDCKALYRKAHGVSLVMGGSVSDYSAAVLENIKMDIAKDTGVSVSAVKLNVAAASSADEVDSFLETAISLGIASPKDGRVVVTVGLPGDAPAKLAEEIDSGKVKALGGKAVSSAEPSTAKNPASKATSQHSLASTFSPAMLLIGPIALAAAIFHA